MENNLSQGKIAKSININQSTWWAYEKGKTLITINFLIELNETPVDKKTKYDDLVNEKVTNGCFNLLKKYIEITSNKKSKAFKVMEETHLG